jgi:hypothetical protein
MGKKPKFYEVKLRILNLWQICTLAKTVKTSANPPLLIQILPPFMM